MAWIESHQKLEKSGKLLHLAELLNINKYQAIGHLHSFWWWALDNAEDGDVTRFSPVTVARICGWSEYLKDEVDLSRINEATNREMGEDAFFGACIKVGFLDKRGSKIAIHNWEEYTHRYFSMVENTRRNREQTRERVKQFRERNADVTQLSNAHVTRSNAPTKPNQTIPNLKTTSPLPPSGGFETLWGRYPNKDGKTAAVRHYKTSVKTFQDWLDIQRALENYLRSERVRKGFIKNGSTWFNNWRDWIAFEEGKHGSHDSPGNNSLADAAKRAREIRHTSGLRKVSATTAGAVFSGLRADAMDMSPVAGSEDREPDGE